METGDAYRLNYPVVGKPDVAFPGARVAVFIDGCFWHGCPDHGAEPKTNAQFWSEKLGRNRQRDAEVGECLARDGWRVLRFWEHEVEGNVGLVARSVVNAVKAAVRK